MDTVTREDLLRIEAISTALKEGDFDLLADHGAIWSPALDRALAALRPRVRIAEARRELAEAERVATTTLT